MKNNMHKKGIILEAMMAVATFALFGVGFSAWVHTGGGTQASIDNINVTVGTTDGVGSIELQSENPYDIFTIGKLADGSKYFYDDETLLSTGSLTVNLVYNSTKTSGETVFKSSIGINKVSLANMIESFDFTGVECSDISVNNDTSADPSVYGRGFFDTTISETGSAVLFSLTFTFNRTLLAANSYAFTLNFEVAS